MTPSQPFLFMPPAPGPTYLDSVILDRSLPRAWARVAP